MVEIDNIVLCVFSPLVHSGKFSFLTRQELLNEEREGIRWIQAITGSLLLRCHAVKRCLEVRSEIVQIHHEHGLQGDPSGGTECKLDVWQWRQKLTGEWQVTVIVSVGSLGGIQPGRWEDEPAEEPLSSSRVQCHFTNTGNISHCSSCEVAAFPRGLSLVVWLWLEPRPMEPWGITAELKSQGKTKSWHHWNKIHSLSMKEEYKEVQKIKFICVSVWSRAVSKGYEMMSGYGDWFSSKYLGRGIQWKLIFMVKDGDIPKESTRILLEHRFAI